MPQTPNPDANAYRNEIAGLNQRVDNLYTALQRMGAAMDPARLFGAVE